MYAHAASPGHRPLIRPATDIVEKRNGILVLVNMPGVPIENVRVEVEYKELSIRGLSCCGYDSHKKPMTQTSENILALEFVDVEYGVRIALEEDLETESIYASLRHGVLSVFLPRQRQRGPRRVKVKSL